MKVLISINHPAWVHQFKSIINRLNNDNNEVLVLSLEKDGAIDLLDAFNIKYIKVGKGTGKNFFDKSYLFIKLTLVYIYYCLKFKPNIIIGRANPMMDVASFITRKRHVIYTDVELSGFSLIFAKLFSSRIITPINFNRNLGKKHVPIHTYKELFYLHPDNFIPNKYKLLKYGINPDKPYYILRFVSHKASHDFGQAGFSNEEKLCLVKLLLPKGKVYISAESNLPQELEQYKLNLPYEDIHHLIYFAQLLVGDSATMASEAAVLGTHAVYRFSKLSSTIKEQEEEFGLVRFLKVPEVGSDEAIKIVEDLAKTPNLHEQGKLKREKLLKEKKNINDYFLNEIKTNITI